MTAPLPGAGWQRSGLPNGVAAGAERNRRGALAALCVTARGLASGELSFTLLHRNVVSDLSPGLLEASFLLPRLVTRCLLESFLSGVGSGGGRKQQEAEPAKGHAGGALPATFSV